MVLGGGKGSWGGSTVMANNVIIACLILGFVSQKSYC
jgi:hypothetical protein